MPIMISVAAALLAVSLTAASTTSSLPPVAVNVVVAADVSPALLAKILDEADAVWRPSGVTFMWRRMSAAAAERLDRTGPDAVCALRIVVGDGRGTAAKGATPLGWIVFDDGSPEQQIYLSYQNARDFMSASAGVVGALSRMTVLEHDVYLARLMGRALAHELGHYLLSSKVHTATGLMRAQHTAFSLFDYDRHSFGLDGTQRRQVAARLRHDAQVVQRHDAQPVQR
jgi:hypothetical protein